MPFWQRSFKVDWYLRRILMKLSSRVRLKATSHRPVASKFTQLTADVHLSPASLCDDSQLKLLQKLAKHQLREEVRERRQQAVVVVVDWRVSLWVEMV